MALAGRRINMEKLFGWIIDLLKLLVPPNTNDLAPQQRWRWTVFAVLMLLMISQAGTFAVEHSYTSWPGYAYETTVSALQSRVDLTTQILLERDMKDKEKELCQTHDQGYKRELSDDIDNLQRQYYNVTDPHHYYKLRGCNEL